MFKFSFKKCVKCKIFEILKKRFKTLNTCFNWILKFYKFY